MQAGRSRLLAAGLLALTLSAAAALSAQSLPTQRALAHEAENAAAEHRWADARGAAAALTERASSYDPDLVMGLSIQAEAAAHLGDPDAALALAARLGELGQAGGLLDRLHPALMESGDYPLLLSLHAAAAAPSTTCRLLSDTEPPRRQLRRWERARAAACAAAP